MTREEAIHVLKEISAILKSWSGFTEYPQAIDTAIEALQADLAKHGEWINKRLTKDSIKDIKDEYWHGYKPQYCPNCGAKMDKD